MCKDLRDFPWGRFFNRDRFDSMALTDRAHTDVIDQDTALGKPKAEFSLMGLPEELLIVGIR